MSAWILGLGVAAGYLINKNMVMSSQLDKSIEEYQSSSNEATEGVTSHEIRDAWKKTSHLKYEDFNAQLPKGEMDAILTEKAEADHDVQQFNMAADTTTLPIKGIMMHFDGHGV